MLFSGTINPYQTMVVSVLQPSWHFVEISRKPIHVVLFLVQVAELPRPQQYMSPPGRPDVNAKAHFAAVQKPSRARPAVVVS